MLQLKHILFRFLSIVVLLITSSSFQMYVVLEIADHLYLQSRTHITKLQQKVWCKGYESFVHLCDYKPFCATSRVI